MINEIINQPQITSQVKYEYKKIPSKIKKQFQIRQNYPLNQQDQDFIYHLLIQILRYPEKDLAQLHRQSNRIGTYDLIQNKNQKSVQKINKIKDQNQISHETLASSIDDSIILDQKSKNNQKQSCPCCSLIKQQKQISICESFLNFPTIGLSTFLYFETIINSIVLLITFIILYCLFSMTTSYIIFCQSISLPLSDCLQSIPSSITTIFSHKPFYQSLSINHNQNINLYKTIQSFLILVTVIVWCLSFYIFKHLEMESQNRVDDSSVTASDFSIMIENVPVEMFKNQKDVEKQFNQYFKNIFKYVQKEYIERYKISNKVIYVKRKGFDFNMGQAAMLKFEKANVGIPFYLNVEELENDQTYQKLKEKLQILQQTFINWVNQFFQTKRLSVQLDKRLKKFNQYKQTQKKLKQMKHTLTQKIKTQLYKTAPDQMTTTVFVTFNCALAAKVVYQLNPIDIVSQIRYILTCCMNNNKLQLKDKNGKVLSTKISRAPQPQDINWNNIGYSAQSIFMRRLVTFIVTYSILFGSYWLITWFTSLKSSTSSLYLSIAISSTISVINVLIGFIIKKLTIFQKDLTETSHQASLAIKSIFAQLVNSIVIPVMIKKDNVYGQKGLIQDVFFLAITSALMPPILKLFNFQYILNIVKFWFKSLPEQRIGSNQTQLNLIAQKMQFEVGFEYIYVANLYIITCFYSPIQPIIPFITIIGLLLMYWIQKYSLLNRSKRPIPGSDTVNLAVGQIIILGPTVLAVGQLVFIDILSDHSIQDMSFLVRFITVIITVIFYMIPFKIIYRLIYSEDDVFQNLDYFQNRILLPTEYDRVNPTTNEEGLKDFKKYLEKINEEVIKKQDKNDNNGEKIKKNLAKILYKIKNQNNNEKKEKSQESLLIKDLFKSINQSQSASPQKRKLPKRDTPFFDIQDQQNQIKKQQKQYFDSQIFDNKPEKIQYRSPTKIKQKSNKFNFQNLKNKKPLTVKTQKTQQSSQLILNSPEKSNPNNLQNIKKSEQNPIQIKPRRNKMYVSPSKIPQTQFQHDFQQKQKGISQKITFSPQNILHSKRNSLPYYSNQTIKNTQQFSIIKPKIVNPTAFQYVLEKNPNILYRKQRTQMDTRNLKIHNNEFHYV